MVYEEQSVLMRWQTFDLVNYCDLDTPRWEPLRDRVLISRDAVPQKEGSLYIPQNCAKERPEGLVVAIGPGKLKINGTFEPLEVKPGDQVMFQAGAGSAIKIKGERFMVVREDDIYGVIG